MTVLVVRFRRGKAENRYGNVWWTFFGYAGKAERGGRRRLVRQEITMMGATIFLDQPHPGAGVSLEV